jgi:hypothetical protein
MSEEKIESSVEKVTEEIVEKAEEKIEDIQEKAAEIVEAKKSKLEVAKEKIAKAKILTAETREQIETCMKNIDSDIEKLNTQKETLFASALQPGETLLKEIGVEEDLLAVLPQSSVELIDLDEDRVEIKELSSGRFKGFFFALLAGIATFMGWAFTSSKTLGFSIPPEKMPDFPRLNKMLEWTSEQIGQGSSSNIGAAALIIAILLIMWIVYSVIVSLRASSNLRVASETEEAVALYCTSKEECKQKMELVREHIQNSSNTLAKYKVLLEEQNAKIRRALFLEEAEGFEGLHANSKVDIATTQHLIAEVKKLLEVPISEAGILTTDAIETLKKANKSVNDHILKLYS